MKTLASLLLIVIALANPARAFDPPATYTDAFLLIQEAEQADRQADWTTAVQRLHGAMQLLQSIRQQAPDWKPALIEFREKYCQQRLAVLQPKLPPPAAPALPRAPAPAAAQAQPAAPAPAPAAPATPLPAAPLAPGVTPSAPPLQAEFTAQPLAELQRQNEALQRQLASAQRQVVDLQTLLARRGYSRPTVDESELRRLRSELATAQAAARELPALQARVDELTRENARLSAQLALASTPSAAADTAELQRIRDELAAVRQAAAARAAQLEKENAELKLLIAAAERKAAAPPAPAPSSDSDEVQRLQRELAEVRAQADAGRHAAQQVVTLQQENQQLRAQLASATAASQPPPTAAEAADTRRLRAELAELRQATTANTRIMQRLREENAYLRNLLERYVSTVPELKGKLGKYSSPPPP